MIRKLLTEKWVMYIVVGATFILLWIALDSGDSTGGMVSTMHDNKSVGNNNNRVEYINDSNNNTEKVSTEITQETDEDKIKRITAFSGTPYYKQLKKNPDKYIGENAIYTGKVVQAQEGDGITNLRIEVTKGEYGTWDDVIFVVYNGTTDAVEDDIVKVYGTLQGDYEYESQAGWKIHVPRLDAEVIKIIHKSK